MKIWKIAMITTLVVALVLGVTIPVLAASGKSPSQAGNLASEDEPPAWGKKLPGIIRGEVIDIDDSLFAIQTSEETPIIYVTEDTKYFIVSAPAMAMHQWQLYPELENAQPPMSAMSRLRVNTPQLRQFRTNERLALFTPQRAECSPNLLQFHNGQGMAQKIRARLPWFHNPGKAAAFGDLESGDEVVVLLAPPVIDALTTEAEEKLTARVVLIIEPSVWNRVAGTIKRLSGDAIVIEPVNGGDVVSLRYDENTTFILKGFTSVETEQFARVVYNTETMMARVVRVWTEAPPILLPAE